MVDRQNKNHHDHANHWREKRMEYICVYLHGGVFFGENVFAAESRNACIMHVDSTSCCGSSEIQGQM